MKRLSSSGVVLIMVLILNAIIYLVISTLFLLIMTETHLAGFEQRSTQAFYVAESAITEGIVRLRSNHENHQVLNELMNVGGHQNALTTTFTPQSCGEDGTSESWYALSLQGLGVVTGPQAATRRTVERKIVIKPFTLLAQGSVTLEHWCHISSPDKTNGNIHGNALVTIRDDATVEGDVSSSGDILIASSVTLTGETSDDEPEIAFPHLSVERYTPKYIYNGAEYQVQPLSLTSFMNEDGTTRLDLYYSGTPGSENPAGVYLLQREVTDSINGTVLVLTALNVRGTVIIRAPFNLKGRVRIEPAVEHFPAFISANGTSITMTFIDMTTMVTPFSDLNVGDLVHIPNENAIQGLIYSAGNINVTAYSDRVNVNGSIFGQNITLNGEAVLNVTYDPGIMTNSPPGLQLVDYGEWREIVEE